MTGLAGLAPIAAGNASACAVLSTGVVRWRGLNNHGQLGNGTLTTL